MLTEIADSLRGAARIHNNIAGARSTEDSPARPAVMTPSKEVKRNVAFVTHFHAVVGQPERPVAARMWPCQ